MSANSTISDQSLMDVQNDTAANEGNSNLPTSMDVTHLLSKLDRLQPSCHINKPNRNIRLIELDPHDHEQSHMQTRAYSKTRLFIAVAFGTQVIVAQLFALELTKVDDPEEEEEEEGEEYEWIDVSDKRINNGSSNENGPVVIFPPSCADPLPFVQQDKSDGAIISEVMKNIEIISCTLIPAPSIRVTTSCTGSHHGEQDRILTRRTVAVTIGTSCGQMFSLLLRVTEFITEPDNTSFMLRYEKYKSMDDERTDNPPEDEDFIMKQPALNQVLPSSKTFDSGEDICTSQENAVLFYGDINAHMQVIHPSKSIHTRDIGQKNKISAISFGRGDWKYFPSRRKNRGHTVILNQDYVWVVYDDNTIVKMPSWKLFFSIDNEQQSTFFQNTNVKDVSGVNSTAETHAPKATAIPVNNPFQSPLDMPPPLSDELNTSGFSNGDIDVDEQLTCSNEQNYWGLLSAAVFSSTQQNCYDREHGADQATQALVLGAQVVPGSTMPLSVQSSRVTCARPSKDRNNQDQHGTATNANMNNGYDEHSYASSSENEQYGLVTGAVVGGTAALVKGALGAALGAVRWGFGGGADGENIQLDDTDKNADASFDIAVSIEEESRVNDTDRSELGGSIGRNISVVPKGETLDLLPWPLSNTSLLFSDVPRRFENAVVDPSSSVIATTDNLGRVILIDLETQQPIRMWKGMRNVSLHFSELQCDRLSVEKPARRKLYLISHAHKRGTIEVYRLRQGPRVAAFAIPHQNQCSVIDCLGPPSDGSHVSTYLFEEMNRPGCKQCMLDYIVIHDTDHASIGRLPQKIHQSGSQTENSIQLNFLVQLLASDTNIQCNIQTIFNTFKNIRALTDLGEGLDIMSKSEKIEQMGSEGSSFYTQALMHCKSRLELAVEKENQEGTGLLQKIVISSLSSKISYHEKLIRSYDVLNRYEIMNKKENNEDDSNFRDPLPLSIWAREAISWISVEENNEFPSASSSNKQKRDLSNHLSFSNFAMACSPPNLKARSSAIHDGVYLTEVKRDRQPILSRFFRPLLEDLFVFKVVNSVFSNLGIDQDFDIQQQYFGEWISSLSSYDIVESNLSGTWRPMIRWLHDLIMCAYDFYQKTSLKLEKDVFKRTVRLQSLLHFCMEMEDLTKSFLIAVICMDAVSTASKQIEEKTYGTITQLESVRPWETVLRKLRVLMLVRFRLCGDVNPVGTGINPLTVKNVSEFSTYYWIARDQLALSHDNQVLMALESACLSSSDAFYPSSLDGDSEANMKVVIQSCSCIKKNSILEPSGVINDSYSRPLLFFFKDHAKFPTHLASHRALILGKIWGQAPSKIMLLHDALSTLQILSDRHEAFSLAVVVEFYQSWIRPICHAMMFGFLDGDDTYKSMLPLIDDVSWRCAFLTLSKRVLFLIIKCTKHQFRSTDSPSSLPKESEFSIKKMWPPLQDDPFFATLQEKYRNIYLSSVELHHTILFAFELTGNMKSLGSVAPAVSELFMPKALFLDIKCTPEALPQQYELLNGLLTEHAKKINPSVKDGCDLDDIEIVGRSMGIDAKYVRTRFFIEAYRFSKDSCVDDLLASNIAFLDKELFVRELVEIVCIRLNSVITTLKRTKSYRGLVGILDANAVRWVKEVASSGPSIQSDQVPVSLITTHSLVLRIQNMNENTSDETLEKNISTISVMSDTLLKAVQSQEQVMNI